MTCWPGTPVDSFLCRVTNMSADMSATPQPDRHMSVVLTLVLTCRHPTLPAKLIALGGLSLLLGYSASKFIKTELDSSEDTCQENLVKRYCY